MKQIAKKRLTWQRYQFYLASFFKNQTYFVPVLVVFFQDIGLSYTEIFTLLTLGSVFSFLIEIPTGVIADLYGKKRSILFSRALIPLAFLLFGFANSFVTLLVAQLVYELAKSFRSGTETAYVFDVLKQHPQVGTYTRIKAMQKFYARVSEAAAALAGGFLAVHYGFSTVFFLAAIPAALNFLQTLFWITIPETAAKQSLRASWQFTRTAVNDFVKQASLRTLALNISLLTAVFLAAGTLIQPYMVAAQINIASFGAIYSGFLILVAFLARYSTQLQQRFGGERLMNLFVWVSGVILLAAGVLQGSHVGVFLLFLLLMIQNLRSPIANDLFHERVQSNQRATMGSLLALSATVTQMILLPIVGLLSDTFALSTALLCLAGISLLTGVVFRVKQRHS